MRSQFSVYETERFVSICQPLLLTVGDGQLYAKNGK